MTERPLPPITTDMNRITPKSKRRLLRPLLFALLPVALAVGGYIYVTGGQVMSTDNAYVQADTVGISTDVSGTVDSIEVHDNEIVKKGQVLFRLREKPFRIALESAQGQLGTVRNQILTLKATYTQALAEIAQAEADIPYYEVTFKRQKDLTGSPAYSRAAYDKARQDLTAAQQRVNVAKAEAAAALAQLSNDPNQPVEQNPFYIQAQAGVDEAQRQLNSTVVRAPFDGIVTNVPALQVGTFLRSAQQAFSLVSTENIWVAASPKETELTYVRPGQPVTITVDTYPGIEWKGTVGSISPASGSSFSLLPAQNTTGNWVKVVQRIPMIVKLGDLADKPQLRVGMSVVVEIDTGHARGLPAFITDLFGGSHDNATDSQPGGQQISKQTGGKEPAGDSHG
ncbi:MAG: HlyD family secretion protein [Rhodospirillaceae bacterium]|nr:MAG: HlyD family secretion protein [Rhodospirillaceae bacterium]